MEIITYDYTGPLHLPVEGRRVILEIPKSNPHGRSVFGVVTATKLPSSLVVSYPTVWEVEYQVGLWDSLRPGAENWLAFEKLEPPNPYGRIFWVEGDMSTAISLGSGQAENALLMWVRHYAYDRYPFRGDIFDREFYDERSKLAGVTAYPMPNDTGVIVWPPGPVVGGHSQ